MSDELASPFRILTVCTGNICRSPAAELLLQAGLGPSVLVGSAGTGALVGRPVDPSMAALLQRDGVSVDGFAARQLTEAQVREADLILAMSLEHRARVVDLAPSAVRRTFTLLEFARIVSSLPLPDTVVGESMAGRLRALLPLATQARSSAGDAAAEWDVPDPYQQSHEEFSLAYRLIKSGETLVSEYIKGNRLP